MDHGRLKMEASVAEVENQICSIVGETRRSAAQYLAFAQRCDLWDQNFESGTLEHGLDRVERSVELNGADHGNGLCDLKIAFEGGDEVRCINTYVNKDIQSLDFGDVNWD